MAGKAPTVVFTAEERRVLEGLASSHTTAYRQVQRAPIWLAAEGRTNTDIAKEIGLSRMMVLTWRQRFIRERLAGLADRPRPGRPRVYAEEDRLRVAETACTKTPPGETHWSIRSAQGDGGEEGRRPPDPP